jgi:uncharacterized protein YndB with AHSA1/START domain
MAHPGALFCTMRLFVAATPSNLAMVRILELVIALVLTVLLFVVIALFLPSQAQVERRIELSNPTTQVYDFLKHFKRYQMWQPWGGEKLTRFQLSGAEFGQGAVVSWTSLDRAVGGGKLTITEAVQDERIVMAIDNEWRGSNKTQTFILEPDAKTNSVTLRWVIDVTYGWDLVGRFAGLYLNGRVGESMNTGLGKIAQILGGVPNVDYSQVEIVTTEVPSTQLFFVGRSMPAMPRQWDEAEVIMTQGWDTVNQFISRNSVEVVGMPRRYVNVLGEETNDFNLAVPVAPTTIVPTGDIRTAQTLATRALQVQYRGHRVGLTRPRDMLRAYALTHGYEFDRDLVGSWEEWLPMPEGDEIQASSILTNVYLPIAPSVGFSAPN